MAKVTLSTIGSGLFSTQALNANFSAIASALENTLSRDGTTPNTMSADLDLNGNALLNTHLALQVYTTATVPSAVTEGAGSVVYVSDGNAGSPCLAVSNGTVWRILALGSTL